MTFEGLWPGVAAPVDQEVSVSLAPHTAETFGRYFIAYDWVGGMGGTTDDRWKVIEDSVSITADPENRRALQVAENWKTENWKLWNVMNPETAGEGE